jgi:UDP-N-acetylmuramate--alanine ligase
MRALVGDEAKFTLYEPLARHTTLRVGGPARFWCEPSTVSAFAKLLQFARENALAVFVVGRGSNLLVRDGGLDGLVIHPEGGAFGELSVDAATQQITAGAAVKLKQIAGAAAKANIAGFEWMEGIPGEVGGSLRMNAGAMGAEMFEQVVGVRYLDADGQLQEATPRDLEVHYRDVPSLKTNYAVSAVFRGRPGDPAEIRRLLDQSTQKRKTSQPIASSAGCIFKNPSKEMPAGRLVDELGLKDTRVGAARVSEVHGNFIVNDGGATADDVLELIGQIQAKARRERGIELQTEVQIVGNDVT